MASTCEPDVPIIYTIATTGLFQPDFVPEICQLVLTKEKTQLFCEYVLPEGAFQEEASEFNGFKIELRDGKRRLVRGTKVVETSTLCKVMKDFIDTIASFRAQVGGRIVLVGYNSEAYDMEVIKEEMLRCGVSTEKISSINLVCADLYQLVLKNKSVLFPAYSGTLKMTTVYNKLCGEEREHKHDALEDAEKLRAIYHAIIGRVSKQTFESCIFPFPVVNALPRAVVPCQTKGETQQQPRRIKRKSTDEGYPQPGRPDVKKACC